MTLTLKFSLCWAQVDDAPVQLYENQLIKLFHKSCFSRSTEVIMKVKHNRHFSLAFSFSYLLPYFTCV